MITSLKLINFKNFVGNQSAVNRTKSQDSTSRTPA